MVNNLINWFEETPPEELKKELEELDHWNDIGPDVEEYCNTVRALLKSNKIGFGDLLGEHPKKPTEEAFE